MPEPRHIALLFRLDQLGEHERQLLAGIRRYAEQAGNWLCTVDRYAGHHLPGPCHGVIAPGSASLARHSARVGTPIVFVSRAAVRCRVARVVENRERAGRLAARHLVARGYRLAAYLGFTKDRHSSLQHKGFLSGARGCSTNTVLIARTQYQRTSRRWQRIGDILARWLDELAPPVGIFAADDALARILAQICQQKGLRIPDDVGLIGAGNDPAICGFPAPALSSIEFDFPQVGYRAARLLDRLMDGQPRPHRNILITPSIVARRSTDRRLVDDPLVARALDHVAHNCHRRTLRPADVAAALGIPLRTLQRRFPHVRGRTLRQEIARARLASAKSLLETTTLTIGAVARSSGFADARHLAKALRQHEGTTPTACRRRNPDGEE